MKKIKYELNGEWVEIEVTDSFAESYELITQESTRNDWKHKKRNQKYHASLEVLTESGFQIASDEPTPAEKFEKQEQIAKLRQAISRLEPYKQKIVYWYFFENKTMEQIAEVLNVQKPAISKQISRILEKLKKLLQ